MTKTARLYGGSLYDLASEEKLTEEMLEQLDMVRALFKEEPLICGSLQNLLFQRQSVWV